MQKCPKHHFSIIIIFIALVGFMGPLVQAQEWSPPVRISEPGGNTFDPQILSIGTCVHVVYEGGIARDSIYYTRSNDEGRTWSGPLILSSSAGWVRYQRIIGNDSSLICFWARQMPYLYTENIEYRISHDEGQTWAAVMNVFNPDWHPATLQFAVSNSDSLINIMVNHPNVGWDIYNVRSTDFGNSWSEPIRIFDIYRLSGACDQTSYGNYVHFVWAGYSDGPMHLNYSRSTDGGISWSEIIWLNADSSWWHYPKISADESGHVAVTWIQNGTVRIKQSFDHGLGWDSTICLTANGMALGYCEIVVKTPWIYLVWMQDDYLQDDVESILFTKSSDNGQSWDDFYWIDRDDLASSNPFLAVFPEGIYTTWRDRRAYPDNRILSSVYFSRWPDFPDVINEGEPSLPAKLDLSAYPNPFNTSTTISYQGIMDGGSLRIYDIAGRLMRTIAIASQSGEVTWDALDDKGNGLSSGVYFLKIGNSNEQSTLKLLLLK